MKKIMFLLLLFAVSGSFVWATEFKVGIIDFEELFAKSEKAKKENSIFQEEVAQKESLGQKMIEEINTLKHEAEIMSPEKAKNAEKEIESKIKKFQEFNTDTKRELEDKSNAIFKKLFQSFKQGIEQKSKDENFTLVLDSKAVFYYDPKLDITKIMIEHLNNQYQGKDNG